MKKAICIILAAFFLIMVPVKGFAASVPFFGIGEEIILPFILSLLGVQASESIDTYNDLVEYNTKIKGSLLEKTAGLAGMEQVQEWLFNVVNGVIDTDSVVWEKLYEYALENYVIASSDVSVPGNNVLSVPAFQYEYTNRFGYGTSGRAVVGSEDCFVCCVNSNAALFYGIVASSNPSAYYRIDWGDGSYSDERALSLSATYDGNTVYYFMQGFARPSDVYINENVDGTYADKIAWLMVYGNYAPAAGGEGIYSDAFSEALTQSEKEDIIDGSNVIQLYNPAELQNGLEIIPGGDPEEDPNLKKIPFLVTADWWNFLQQFGSGTNSNQYVNAYNALNGLDNTSIGRISDAYDSLGIASIAGTAANAAQGIISLTDNNIYPASQTAADTITNTIPGSLTPESPDSSIDNESEQGLYKLPDLRDYFPFCIPFDLIDLLRCFVAEPETPSFVLALSTGSEMAQESFDLHMWDNIASMVRTFELVGFVLGLILITRNLIRG